jgi:hypothetical protein
MSYYDGRDINHDEIARATLEEDNERFLIRELPGIWTAVNLLAEQGLLDDLTIERVRAKVHDDCCFWIEDSGHAPEVVRQLEATRARTAPETY